MQSLKRRIRLTFFLVVVFFAIPLGSASASIVECDYSKEYTNPQTIYIEATGADDQNVINSAIQQLDGINKISVFLKEGTYVLSGSINMKDTSMLEGDQNTIVQLPAHAGWKTAVPLIAANNMNNVEIKCFQIDGNYNNNTSSAADSCYRPLSWNSDFSDCEGKTDDRLTGRGYYDVAHFSNGENFSMHDMYLHDGAGDGMRVNKGRKVKFYDNLVYKLGHDAVVYYNSEYAEVWRNKITIRNNAGVRLENSNNVSVHDNLIEAFDHWSAGGPGVEVVKDDRGTMPMNQVYIYYNTFHHTYGPGVHIVASGDYGKGDTAAYIHNNIFYETGLNYSINWVGGIVTSGFYDLNIENNTFDRVYNHAIVAAITANNVSDKGYEMKIKNNIIIKTQNRRNSAGGESQLQGVGITNLAPETHKLIVSYNDVWYNKGGDIIGQGIELGEGNITLDPLFVDEVGHDYHLKTGSPAIDTGDPASDFTKEPDPNGGRIDMGRYGNTSEAGAGKTGIAAAINPNSGSDGTGSDTVGSVSSGDGGSGSGATNPKTDIPAYWDPGAAVTDPAMTNSVEAALSPEEKTLEALYGPLGESATTATATCSTIEGAGGIIPCGRNTDSSGTAWNECDACDLCGIVLMGQLSIEFMVKIAAVAANLTIIFAGFLYIFASGEMGLVAKAKLIMRYTILGFIIVFAAWAIVDSLLTVLGYIDPLEGEWYTVC